jgi:signal transduction histidine kinase
MVQLFTNILDNSIKYKKKEPVVIDIEAKAVDTTLRITIRDNGAGIDERDLPNIFNIFYRGRFETDESVPEGAGVGLSIVKRIAEQHGGSVTVSSTRGEGTCVTVVLPLQR